MTSPDSASEKLGILLVDDQDSKLLSYEVILAPLGERLLFARSGADALQILLKNEVAVVLVDVSMPGLDGFELASMIQEHPRFDQLAIIFVSAIHISVADILRGYEKGAVDYIPVPIVPELLRAKVSTFIELHRKTRQLERLNRELEDRVKQRTEALEAAIRRQELLAREVDHRARNALAVVKAIVSLTRADDVETFAAAVHGRIRALARAHQLLSNSRWEGADIAGIAHEELAPYSRDDRVSVAGPPTDLSAPAAQMVALAIHELATNAAKHGALSNEKGRVDLTWTADEERICIVWRESGGPLVAPPQQRGFGTAVIEESMAAQLHGEVRMDWRLDGLVCTAILPFRSLAPEGGAFVEAALRHVEDDKTPSGGGRPHVLLVEDEVIVAMELEGVLRSMGCDVIGPAHTLSDALAASQATVDLAILDVNLRGEDVSPLAELLQARGVPTIFLTGYDSISPRLSESAAAVLQKPFQSSALSSAINQALEGTQPLGLARAQTRAREHDDVLTQKRDAPARRLRHTACSNDLRTGALSSWPIEPASRPLSPGGGARRNLVLSL